MRTGPCSAKHLLKATTCLFLTAGAGVSSVWATPETTESMRTEMVQQQTVTVSGVVKDRKGDPYHLVANIHVEKERAWYHYRF